MQQFTFTHKEDNEIDDITLHAANKEAARHKLERLVKNPLEWEVVPEVVTNQQLYAPAIRSEPDKAIS